VRFQLFLKTCSRDGHFDVS